MPSGVEFLSSVSMSEDLVPDYSGCQTRVGGRRKRCIQFTHRRNQHEDAGARDSPPRQTHNPCSLKFFPTPTMLDPPPMLIYDLAMTSLGGRSTHSGPSPLQQVAGVFPLLNRLDSGSYSRSHQRHHYDENSGASTALTFLEHDEVNTVTGRPAPPRGPSPDTETSGYGLFAGLEDRQEKWAKLQEAATKGSGASPVTVPAKPPFDSRFTSSHPTGRLLTSNINRMS